MNQLSLEVLVVAQHACCRRDTDGQGLGQCRARQQRRFELGEERQHLVAANSIEYRITAAREDAVDRGPRHARFGGNVGHRGLGGSVLGAAPLGTFDDLTLDGIDVGQPQPVQRRIERPPAGSRVSGRDSLRRRHILRQ
ncbi:MAG: hypothetical protein P8N02_09010 [Actinomycetota bacterium]|nr:hypothetical protein [Actinomycetota bacterium]